MFQNPADSDEKKGKETKKQLRVQIVKYYHSLFPWESRNKNMCKFSLLF